MASKKIDTIEQEDKEGMSADELALHKRPYSQGNTSAAEQTGNQKGKSK